MVFSSIDKFDSCTSVDLLEVRYLKLAILGFSNNNKKINFSFDIKLKQILKDFIQNTDKLVNKVIENKYEFLSLKKKQYYNLKYKQIFNVKNDLSQNESKLFFKIFLFDLINKTNINKFYFLDFNSIYKRFFSFFWLEDNVNFYFLIVKEKMKNLTISVINKVVYSVQIYDKMIKLITKIVLLNSKFFFLNNVRYNYTLLKLCDKTMKLVNSILLFCLLCDINIPYYCFHSDLSIAGNCRMCLVQLDTSLKPIASCAVSIGINSTIYTNTKLIQKAREGVLEFLLINHPLDCPICDQGGECDLQEQFITYGNDRGRFLRKMI